VPEPVRLPVQGKINLASSPAAMCCGAVVVAITVALYIVFW
jgi:hypothetical protein